MRVNIFVGIEGTHPLIGELFESSDSVALPNISMFVGPEARANKDNPVDEIIHSLFDDTDKDECNIGVSRLGAAGLVLDSMLTNFPQGTRVFFFKLTDEHLSKQLQEQYLLASAEAVVTRLTGETKESVTEKIDSISSTAILQLDTLATKFDTLEEWTNFDATSYFGGATPEESGIKVRILVK